MGMAIKLGLSKKIQGHDEMVPKDAQTGYFGDEHHRFVVNTKMLKHVEFQWLLDKSAQEYGYKYEGGLIIPCKVEFFQRLLKHIKEGGNHSSKWIDWELFQAFATDINN
jgi:hypothetical protein